jgi:hypothetical protein
MRDDSRQKIPERGFAAIRPERRQMLARTGWQTLKLDAKTGALVHPLPAAPGRCDEAHAPKRAAEPAR